MHARGHELVTRLYDGLAAIPGVRVYGPAPDQPRTPTVAFVVTFFGADMRNGRDIGLGFGLFALMTIQAIIPSYKHPEVGALHPLNALLLLGLAVHLLMRDRAPGQPAAQVSNSV